jgi:hypothetical protein
MVALHVPVTVHLLAVAVLVGVGVPLAVRGFLPDEVEQEKAKEDAESDRRISGWKALHAWREPPTLLIGLFVLAFAFAEGVGNDWIGIAPTRDAAKLSRKLRLSHEETINLLNVADHQNNQVRQRGRPKLR